MCFKSDGRTTLMKPCCNGFELKDSNKEIGDFVFQRTAQDEKPRLSIEDKQFLNIMDCEFVKHSSCNWVAPLPFRADRP